MLQREIELMLRNNGFERGSRMGIMRLAEEIEDVKRVITEMAQVIESMTTVVNMLNSVADGMKDKIDKMQRQDSDPRATQDIARGN